MLALAVLAASARTWQPVPAGLIPLTCNEIARLINRLIIDPARHLADPLSWAVWRWARSRMAAGLPRRM